jgi:hypothetical protein
MHFLSSCISEKKTVCALDSSELIFLNINLNKFRYATTKSILRSLKIRIICGSKIKSTALSIMYKVPHNKCHLVQSSYSPSFLVCKDSALKVPTHWYYPSNSYCSFLLRCKFSPVALFLRSMLLIFKIPTVWKFLRLG